MTDHRRGGGFSRRSFIKAGAAGAATIAAGAAVPGSAVSARDFDSLCDGSRDLDLVNGRFLTMDADNSVASSVSIRDGRIVKLERVGNRGGRRDDDDGAHGASRCSRTINLRGATVIPGSSTRTCITYAAARSPATGAHHRDGGLGNGAAADDRGTNEVGTGRPVHHERRRLEHQRTFRSANANAGRARFGCTPTRGLSLDDGTRRRGDEQSRAHVLPVPQHYRRCERRPQPTQALAALQAVQTDADRQRSTGDFNEFAAGLGVTMVTDMGTAGAAVEGIKGYDYDLNLWRLAISRCGCARILNSSDDTGFAIAQAWSRRVQAGRRRCLPHQRHRRARESRHHQPRLRRPRASSRRRRAGWSRSIR